MSAEVIALLEKNSRERIRVALDTYKGADLVDVRVCVMLSESSGVWTPTQKGVSFRRAMLPDVLQALSEAQAAIEANKDAAA